MELGQRQKSGWMDKSGIGVIIEYLQGEKEREREAFVLEKRKYERI